MSLGPVNVRTQRIAGAVLMALVAGAVAAILGLSDRSFGDGVRFEVELSAPGALKVGARIRIAGREVGEVRGMRGLVAAGGAHHVAAACFVVREYAAHVHDNSDLFIATPSILGEAWLEVGPPLHGATPGAAITDGARVRGSDPPDVDRLLARMYSSTTEAMLLLREHKPEFDELFASIESLMATLSRLPIEKGQLGRIRDQAALGVVEAQDLAAAISRTRAVPRMEALSRQIAETADHARPDLADIARRADRAADGVAALGDLVGPARREKVERGLRAMAAAARSGDRIFADVTALADSIDRGDGAVGGFLTDKELWDDLHETHRLLKWKGWRLFLKPSKNAATAPE